MKNILIDKHTSKFEEVKTSKKPGVLATIRGAVSGWKPNRNGRTYSRELWKKAVNSEFVREQIALKHFIGEADHPEDRLDPAFEHMSHAISDFEFRDDRAELWATIDILDTPDGQKLKTLLDYSGSLSFSTRGSGDVMENGEVDPDTYQLFAIDSVIRPSYPTATVLAESENLGNMKTITESEALKVLEAYSGNAYGKKLSVRETSMKDDLFILNHRNLFESLNEGSSYSHDDLEYVIGLVDEFHNQMGLDDDEVYDRVESMLRDTDLEGNDYIIWDAMAYVIDNNMDQDEDGEELYDAEEVEEKEAKTAKEFRIIDTDTNEVVKVFSADQESEGYEEMRAMGGDNLIYKEFRVKAPKSKLEESVEEIAYAIVDFMDDYDPYEFRDVYSSHEEAYNDILDQLENNYDSTFESLKQNREDLKDDEDEQIRDLYNRVDKIIKDLESLNEGSLNEFFGKKKKQAPKQNNGGDPSKCEAIECSLMVWFEENTEDLMDRYVDCKANEEGFSYVITVKSPYIGRYNLFDEYDVMDYADEAGKYIADRLKIEYIKSVKVNDRTFKIYLDNYYTA